MLGLTSMDTRLALLRGPVARSICTITTCTTAPPAVWCCELRNAAARGVRVRLLVDDLYTDDSDALLNGLGAYDNIEVRLFNPFPTRGRPLARFASALFDFARLNRRMHNKLFVADGVLAVAGGRNLGDEYFMRGTESNFFDYDVLVAVAAVP